VTKQRRVRATAHFRLSVTVPREREKTTQTVLSADTKVSR
jgi:hypothetical protein